MPARAILDALRARLAEAPSRTGSLIVTIYGDAIVPRGGSLALATLASICAALDIGDGVVRTAASRLAADGWLERTRIGRLSFYRLAARGAATFAEATVRIYGSAQPAWDGRFALALGENGTTGASPMIGRLAPGLLVAPIAWAETLPAAALRLTATAEDPYEARVLAARAWPLADIAARYERFLTCLEPAGEVDREAASPAFDDLDALLLRILLVHEYRKILLRDPLLPAVLLPDNWPGHRAQRHCARLYRRLVPASERWLDHHAVNESGALPPPDAAFARRFSGIPAVGSNTLQNT